MKDRHKFGVGVSVSLAFMMGFGYHAGRMSAADPQYSAFAGALILFVSLSVAGPIMFEIVTRIEQRLERE